MNHHVYGKDGKHAPKPHHNERRQNHVVRNPLWNLQAGLGLGLGFGLGLGLGFGLGLVTQ